jgi:GNAT superfamily N-acetyltransferase
VDDRELFARQHESLRVFVREFPKASPGGRALELGGVTAAITPATPERSVMNSVVYRDVDALAAAVGPLAASYEEAGIRAWTVWVPERDIGAVRVLEGAGHVLDAQPMAMGVELDERFEQPPAEAVRRELDMRALGRLNDVAYGHEFSPAMQTEPELPLFGYLAPPEGEAQSCAVTYDADGDCGVFWVATAPEARGRGLASLLMRAALADARERGCTTSTLQATAVGHPVYARLGYRDLGRLQMWERRR